jgi:hypothetical protein
MDPSRGDERQALIQRDEDQTMSDVENPHTFLKQECDSRNNKSRGLLQAFISPLLEPIQCLCSCSWMSKTLQSDPMCPKGKKSQGHGVDRERVVKVIKYSYSMSLLAFCLNMVTRGIFAEETPVAKYMHPVVAFSVMWVLILWLGMLEGGQGCLVGLQPIDKASYAASHPTTHRCTTMAHNGDNLNRFIIGRQFLVVLVVFCFNLCCTTVEDAVVPGFSHRIIEVFLGSGLAVMLITVILAQLAAEVNATNCMLDFINTPSMVVTTWVCLAVETSGLLHSVYLVQYCFAIFTGKSVTSDEPSRTAKESLFFWARVVFSLLLLSYAFAVTLSALLNGQTTMCAGLPDVASMAIFVGLICFLGMLEAMQIALFAVVNLPEEDLEGNPAAQANCELAFRGQNFKAFLIGRQICVTTCMFLLARITTTAVDIQAGEETVLNVSSNIQYFFNTGLPGALITTIVASLAWRITASSFPVAFMANPFVNVTIRLCLLLEASGVFSTAWLLADIIKTVLGFQPDELYLGELGQGEADKNEEEGVALENRYGATTH